MEIPDVEAPSVDVVAEDVSGQTATSSPEPKEVKPEPVGARASELPPVAAAGVDLVKIVLLITASSILALLGYLMWSDWSIANEIQGAFKNVLNSSSVGSEYQDLDRLDRLASELANARGNPDRSMSPEALESSRQTIRTLAELPSLSAEQKSQINECVPLPTDSSRIEKLDRCLAVLGAVRHAAVEAAAGLRSGEFAGKAAEKVNEQRQNLHQFWMQVAQLILLNLLLPLLTALFGYIFGTQQRSQSEG